MNFFTSPAPTAAEVQRESAIKDQITENLRQALKALQVAHVNSEQPIESEDTANAVCCVLEAVFLHGLKTPMTNKLYSMTGHSTEQNSWSFWGLLQKSTHKNTLSQLKKLRQITTEIGLCRAWLRLALNEGVLESYMDAILADSKTIRQYYSRTAYLRDAEHPGILKTYTQSLSNFYFQLSYNSSVLNMWSNTPLTLAGLASPPPDPKPVIAVKPPVARVLSTPSSSSATSIKVDHNTKKSKSKSSRVRASSRNISTFGEVGEPVTPHDTPYDPSALTSTDIEAIRSLTTRHRGNSESASSTNTSQISHPDPVDARLLDSNLPELKLSAQREREEGSATSNPASQPGATEKSTVLPKSQGNRIMKEDMVKHMEKNCSVFQNGNLFKGPPGNDSVEHTTPYDGHLNPFDRDNDDSNPFNTNEDVHDHLNPFVEEYEESLNPFENDAITASQSDKFNSSLPDLDPCETAEAMDTTDTMQTANEGSNISSAKMQENCSADQDTNDSASIYDIYQPKRGNKRKSESSRVAGQPSQSSRDATEGATASSTTCSPQTHGATSSSTPQPGSSPPSSLYKSSSFPKLALGKSPPLEPEMSTATATSDKVEVAKEALLGLGDSTGDTDFVNMDDYEVSTTGNSLVGKEGWSSDFETSHQSEDSRFLQSQSHIQPPLMTTSVNESFDNMVYNYSSSLGRHDAPTMSEVLDGLPAVHSRPISMETSSSSEEAPKFQRVLPLEDQVIDEYEVLPDMKEKRAYLSQARYQPLLDLLGLICTEKGLDLQNYQCKGCSRPVGMFYGKARVCGYDACYYCYECHENEEAYVPARVVFNWDFRKQKVCRQNFQFLQQSEDDPLLNISDLNPKLYDHVQEMADIKKIRMQLRFLKAYLFSCKQLIADEFRKQIWPREYYYNDVDVYSLNDLLQVATNQLQFTLTKVVKFGSKHVYDCGLCSQKGFICEMCNSPKVIYPFEMDSTVRCERCKAVYHRDCKKSRKCPKCARRQERLSRLGSSSASTPDSISDYALSPIPQLPVV